MSKLTRKLADGEIKAPDLNIKKNYKKIRKFMEFLRVPKLKPLYKEWDYKVVVRNYEVPVRVFYPKSEGTHPLIIFYHGGGWVTGNIDTYTKVCRDLANHTNHIILSVDYRLAPEHKFPIGFNDCYEVTRYVMKNAKLFNITKKDITIMGDSAGGNIAACISQKGRDNRAFIPTKQILIYPATSGVHKSAMYPSIRDYRNSVFLSLKELNDYMDLYKRSDFDLKRKYFAPMNNKNLKNQPDTLLITAELDILRDEAEDYGIQLLNAGNKVEMYRMPDAGHGFFSNRNTPDVKAVYDLINKFLGND